MKIIIEVDGYEKFDKLFLENGEEILEEENLLMKDSVSAYTYIFTKMGRGVIKVELQDVTVAYILGVEDCITSGMARIDVYDCEKKVIKIFETVQEAMDFVNDFIIDRLLGKLDPLWSFSDEAIERGENPPLWVWENDEITLEWKGIR